MKWTRERKGGGKRSGCKTIETKGKKYNETNGSKRKEEVNEPDVRVEKRRR